MTKQLIAVIGPTASGKTALAIRLALHYKTEIVSADSRQLFRELNIGAARPSPEELAIVPHHLIASHSVAEPMSAGRYADEAHEIIDRLFTRFDRVILVGGSGLYIKAVCEGLHELPPADNLLRKELEAEIKTNGPDRLAAELKEKDPDHYAKTDLANPRRLIRAIEILRLSGGKISDLQQPVVSSAQHSYSVVKIALDPGRSRLYERINDRTEGMMQAGLYDEVRSLMNFRDLAALQTVGYTELFRHLEDPVEHPLQSAVNLIKQNTRRFAKRQMTWFRADQKIAWINPDDPAFFESALAIIDQG